jgi:cytochrome c556
MMSLLLLCLTAGSLFAEVKVTGKGSNLKLDASKLPPNLQPAYAILNDRCTKCHSQERIVISFLNGVAPVSGQPFDSNAMKSLIYTMVRKANAKPATAISKEQEKEIVALMKYLMEESTR